METEKKQRLFAHIHLAFCWICNSPRRHTIMDVSSSEDVINGCKPDKNRSLVKTKDFSFFFPEIWL